MTNLIFDRVCGNCFHYIWRRKGCFREFQLEIKETDEKACKHHRYASEVGR